MGKNYYEILGVSKTANDKEIKKKYKELAKIHHPDKGGDESKFKEISEAYEILSNSEKRENYDKFGDPNGRPQRNYHDDFMDFYNNRRTQRRNQFTINPDVKIRFHLTLEEIFNGVEKKIKYKRKKICSSCDGHGGHNPKTCTTCNGAGVLVERYQTPMGFIENVTTCHSCGGAGTKYTEKCGDCFGEGFVETVEEITVTIPKGVYDNDTMVLDGMGNEIEKNRYGGLLVNIKEVTHNQFQRIRDDLFMEIKVDYYDLLLGCDKEIDTIEGKKIKITLPKLTKVNSTMRLKGLGMCNRDNPNYRGNLMLKIDINFPEELGVDEIDLLNEIKKSKEKR
jgi:molecular chaperone DnaJ